MAERLVFNYGTSGHDGSAPSRGEEVRADVEPPRAIAVAAPERPVVRLQARGRDWGFIGLMAFTAFLFFRPQDHLRFLSPFHFAEIAAIIGLVAMTAGRLRRGQHFSRITPELVGVAALGGIILLTAPFSIWPGGSVATFTDLYVKV